MQLKIKAIGTLVTINGSIPVVAAPATNIVVKSGKKQFWFYHNNRAILATQSEYGWNAKY